MKILLLADEPNLRLWDYLDRSLLEGVELVISCGDLPADYLSFITCFTSAPVLYIHGNHDTRYDVNPPEGCVCIEDAVYLFRGLRIAGLGGSMRYKPGKYQYTEREMEARVRRLKRRLRRCGGCDILVAHAPMKGVGDTEDLAHQGFQALRKLVEEMKPSWFVHGHVHKNYGVKFQRVRTLGETTVVNAWTSYEIQAEAPLRKLSLLTRLTMMRESQP